MSDFIDLRLEPSLWLLGDWSLRWAVLIAALAIWFALGPPRQASLRLAACRLVLLAGLALPLVPRWWGHQLLPARWVVAAEELPTESLMTESPDPAIRPSKIPPKAASIRVRPQPIAVAERGRSEVPATESTLIAPTPAAEPLGLLRVILLTAAALWFVGACFQLIRLIAGAIYLSRLRRGAQRPRLQAQELFDRCRDEIGLRRSVRLGIHPALAAPVFVGSRRAWVLVPTDWERLAPDAQRAVLWHELAHVARRDDWAKFAEEIVRAVFFFHPLVHWLLNRIDAYREQVCDTAAVQRGIAGRMLAQILIDFSRRSASPGQPDLALRPALPFFRRPTVRNRIRELLEEATVGRWSAPLARRQFVGLAAIAIATGIALGGFGPHAEGSHVDTAPPIDAGSESPPPAAPATASEKSPPTTSGTAAAKTLERIRTNWRARRERMRSVYVSWENRLFVGQAAEDRAKGKLTLQQADRRSSQSSYWSEGSELFRLDSAPLAGLQPRGDVVPTKTHSVINGLTELRVEDPGDAGGVPICTLSRRRDQRAWRAWTPRSLLLAFRPLDAIVLNYSWKAFRLVSDDAVIDGLHCAEIQITNDRGNLLENFWVDPARDDIVVAYEFQRTASRPDNRHNSRRTSIRYGHDRDNGWVLAGWTSNDVWELSENTVVKYAINERFPEDTFTLNVAPAIVFNKRTLERYRVAKDGTKADIVQFDSPKSLEIENLLESTSDFRIEPQTLKDALDFIAARYQIPIVVFPADYEAAGIKPAIEVGPLPRGLSVSDLLKRLLSKCPKSVGFRIEDEVLKISTKFAGQGAIPAKPAAAPQRVEGPQARRIQAALESPIDFNIEPQSLKDALDFIGARYQFFIETDSTVPLTTNVHFSAPGIRLNSLLALLLEQCPKPVGFKIDGDALKIYTQAVTP
jgi:BlaR1 peptidase M56